MRKILNIAVYTFAGIGFILVLGYFAVRFGFTNTEGVVDNQHDYFQNQITLNNSWKNSEEWKVLKEAIKKDTAIIDKASHDSDIPSRYIVSLLIVEQLRLFNSEREIFKQIFSPLKILGNQNQFSLGVMGIKQETAKQIEENLKNPSSLWYLDKESENILDFNTSNIDSERFERLTNADDRYYSYLYAGLYIKQIESQWQKEGYDISKKIDIIATLYNIGFSNSKPKAEPQSGGAEIIIGDAIYSFGSLAENFFESEELISEFPRY